MRAKPPTKDACASSPLRIEYPRLADGSTRRDFDRFTLRLVARALDTNRVPSRRHGVLDDRRRPDVAAVDEHLARRGRVDGDGAVLRRGGRGRGKRYLAAAIS